MGLGSSGQDLLFLFPSASPHVRAGCLFYARDRGQQNEKTASPRPGLDFFQKCPRA